MAFLCILMMYDTRWVEKQETWLILLRTFLGFFRTFYFVKQPILHTLLTWLLVIFDCSQNLKCHWKGPDFSLAKTACKKRQVRTYKKTTYRNVMKNFFFSLFRPAVDHVSCIAFIFAQCSLICYKILLLLIAQNIFLMRPWSGWFVSFFA